MFFAKPFIFRGFRSFSSAIALLLAPAVIAATAVAMLLPDVPRVDLPGNLLGVGVARAGHRPEHLCVLRESRSRRRDVEGPRRSLFIPVPDDVDLSSWTRV